MTLDECRANIGAAVVYTAPHGAREQGVITGVGHLYAFVHYGTDKHSKATHPSQLRLLEVP